MAALPARGPRHSRLIRRRAPLRTELAVRKHLTQFGSKEPCGPSQYPCANLLAREETHLNLSHNGKRHRCRVRCSARSCRNSDRVCSRRSDRCRVGLCRRSRCFSYRPTASSQGRDCHEQQRTEKFRSKTLHSAIRGPERKVRQGKCHPYKE